MTRQALTDSITLIQGDCLEVLEGLAEEKVQARAVITDPPYHLQSIVKRFGNPESKPPKDGVYNRFSKGFAGKEWDGGDIAFRVDTWARCYDVLLPGGWIASFSSTRNYHRMAVAIEEAGFIPVNIINWLYASGYPKNHNIPAAMDKLEGIEPEKESPFFRTKHNQHFVGRVQNWTYYERPKPTGKLAKEWADFGTALKPACEPITLQQKPITENTIAENVLKYGTGVINIEESRIPDTPERIKELKKKMGKELDEEDGGGRWPSNVITDGSKIIDDKIGLGSNVKAISTDAQFYYCAKPRQGERHWQTHPTIKPIALMRYLVNMLGGKKGGLIIDPFGGSGTTALACHLEGFRCIIIEKEKEYADMIKYRIDEVTRQKILDL